MKKWISGRLSIDILLAFLFGVIFILALLIIAIVVENPQGLLPRTFRVVIALAAGGIGAVIPGILKVKWGDGRNFSLRAGGALALFVIVFYWFNS